MLCIKRTNNMTVQFNQYINFDKIVISRYMNNLFLCNYESIYFFLEFIYNTEAVEYKKHFASFVDFDFESW